jgi:hypothetical protein
MRIYKKLILTALVVVVLLGATPLAAQLYGTWAGTGEGCCYPGPGVVIYPWQTWKGEVYISSYQDVPIFEGEWWDADGNHGTFKGKPIPSIPEIAVFRGEWTWFDPTGTSARPRYGGDFEMIFYFMSSHPYCEGTWTSIWPSPGLPGTMKGEKVD